MNDFLIVGVSTLIFIFMIYMLVSVYRSGRSLGRKEGRPIEYKEKGDTYFREILSRDQEIKDLRRTVDDLNGLNSKYLTFMLKVSMIIQRLNSTLKLEEIVESITMLIKDIIPTNLVHLYLYNSSDNTVKRVHTENSRSKRDSADKSMELIELAARDRIVRISGQLHAATANTNTTGLSEAEFWMAVPIIFRERLIGVIGIGKPTKIAGNETNLMKMIADIAAVTVVNQAVIGEAKQQANTDPLTGISNRNYFIHMGQTFVENAIRDNFEISIFLFDIDNFKQYNDTNGHDAGDRLLIELTDLVSNITRKAAVFARYGGEEFIVMLPGISKEDTFVYAERVRKKISGHPFLNRESQPLGCVSISGGVATFPTDGNTLSRAIQLADESLYKAKQEGRNRIIAYTPRYFSSETPTDMQEYSGMPGTQQIRHL